jgi:D-3-phosphoglycerate dehydrogenase
VSKVLIHEPIVQEGLDVLLAAGHTPVPKDELQVEDCQEIEGFIARSSPVTAEYLCQFPNLKVIARHGVGVNNIDIEYATRHGIIVANAPYSNVISVAEHVFGMMLYLAREFPLADELVRSGRFRERDQHLLSELKGKTLGVVGFGKIGRQVTAIAKNGFDMKVLVYDSVVTVEDEDITQVASLEELLPQVDYLTLHVPYIKSTANLINARTLSLMKPSAVLINCARGEVVDMDALYEALNSGKLKAAGIDVFPGEYPDLKHPIFGLKNVLFTPHHAALTHEAMIRMATGAAEAVVAVLAGTRPESVVNPEVLQNAMEYSKAR